MIASAHPKSLLRVGSVVTRRSSSLRCGDDVDTAAPGESGGAGDTTSSMAAAAAEAGDRSAAVAVGETSLGRVLVDGDGMTLFLFTPDGDGTPTCEDSCAELWPPVIVEGDPVAGDGVDASLVGTVEPAPTVHRS